MMINDSMRKQDIAKLIERFPQFCSLENKYIERLWSWFSTESREAGWLTVDDDRIEEFAIWAFSSPYDHIMRYKASMKKKEEECPKF